MASQIYLNADKTFSESEYVPDTCFRCKEEIPDNEKVSVKALIPPKMVRHFGQFVTLPFHSRCKAERDKKYARR